MLVVSSHSDILVISHVIHNQGFTSVASVFSSSPDHNSTEAEQVFSCCGAMRANLPWLKMLLLLVLSLLAISK